MERFADFLKIDEQVVFERLGRQLRTLAPEARMLGFVAFHKDFLLEPLLEHVRELSRMRVAPLAAEAVETLFGDDFARERESLHVLNLYPADLAVARRIFALESVRDSLKRERDFNALWLMNHRQMNAFAQRYFEEMKTNCFVRILYDRSLVFTSLTEKNRGRVLASNLAARAVPRTVAKEAFEGGLAEANRLLRAGDFAASERIYLELARAAVDEGREDRLAKAKGNLGVLYRLTGRYREAEEALREQFTIDSKSGNETHLLSCYANRASVSAATGDFESAFKLLDLKEALERRLGNSESLAETDNQRAGLWIRLRRYDKASERLEKAREACERGGGRKETLAVCCGNSALVQYQLGNNEAALQHLREEERLLIELDRHAELPPNLQLQAKIYAAFGKTGLAGELLENVTEYLAPSGNRQAHAESLADLADWLAQAGSNEKALETFEEAERLFPEADGKGYPTDWPARKASLLLALGRSDAAEKILDEKTAKDDPDDPAAVASSLILRAGIALQRDRPKEALASSREAITLWERLGDGREQAAALGIAARCLLRLKEYATARRTALTRLTLENKHGNVAGIIQTHRALADATKGTGDFEEAKRHNFYAAKLETILRNGSRRHAGETDGNPVSD